MDKESYPLLSQQPNSYTFVSMGKQGQILKLVQFQEVEAGIYNLALADYDALTKSWNDKAASDNGDMGKIMATCIYITGHFLNQNPQNSVLIQANTRTKNLLYNRIIRNNFQELSEHFHIYGMLENEAVPYSVDCNYDLFYIYLK